VQTFNLEDHDLSILFSSPMIFDFRWHCFSHEHSWSDLQPVP